MKRRLALVLIVAILVAGSVGLAVGKACPPASHNPGGTPPNCGHAPQRAGTCETRGVLGDGTVANRIFGTKNEDGPLSKELHAREGQFMQLGVVVHEGGCGAAAAEDLLGQ